MTHPLKIGDALHGLSAIAEQLVSFGFKRIFGCNASFDPELDIAGLIDIPGN